MAHPSGHVEVSEGTVAGTTVALTSRLIAATTTAKEVTVLSRRLTVDGDVLRYTTAMEAVGVAIQEHLAGELRRSP